MERVLADGCPARVWLRRAGPHRMPWRHRHRELELNLVLAGRAAYLCDDRRLELSPGDLLWLHAGHDHLLIDESPDFRMWLALWSPALIATEAARGLDPEVAAERPAGEHLRHLAPVPARGLERLFADLAEAEGGALPSGSAYLLWRARAAFAEAAEAEHAAVHPAVARAVRLLHADPGLAVGAVAQAVGLSPDHLARRFRAELGLGLAAWREGLRLDRAVAACEEPGRDLMDIALAAGFGSYSAFHRAFRRRFGCAPRRHRRGGAT